MKKTREELLKEFGEDFLKGYDYCDEEAKQLATSYENKLDAQTKLIQQLVNGLEAYDKMIKDAGEAEGYLSYDKEDEKIANSALKIGKKFIYIEPKQEKSCESKK